MLLIEASEPKVACLLSFASVWTTISFHFTVHLKVTLGSLAEVRFFLSEATAASLQSRGRGRDSRAAGLAAGPSCPHRPGLDYATAATLRI